MTAPIPTSIHVSAARADDVAALWPLVQQLAATAVPERAAFERTFAELLTTPTTLVAVARAAARHDQALDPDDDQALDPEVRGYVLAHLQPTFFANAPVAWVQEVVVDETVRRGGVGRALMVHVEAWAAQHGAAYVSLASRRAGDFYEALGYTGSATFYKKPLA